MLFQLAHFDFQESLEGIRVIKRLGGCWEEAEV
jgi:hypothetical protein